MTTECGDLRIVRPAPIVRWCLAPLFLVGGLWFGTVLLYTEYPADRWLGVGFILGSASLACWLMFYARVELQREHVVIVNVVHRKVPYREIVDVETPPPFGDMIIRTDHRTYRSFAIAKDNVSRMLGRQTRVDALAEEIRQRARKARA